MTEGTSAIDRLRCSEIMTKDVRTASPEASLREVAALMRDGDMGAVPIVDGKRLIGIVTDRDIVVRAVAIGIESDRPIKEAMTTELLPSVPTILYSKPYG